MTKVQRSMTAVVVSLVTGYMRDGAAAVAKLRTKSKGEMPALPTSWNNDPAAGLLGSGDGGLLFRELAQHKICIGAGPGPA